MSLTKRGYIVSHPWLTLWGVVYETWDMFYAGYGGHSHDDTIWASTTRQWNWRLGYLRFFDLFVTWCQHLWRTCWRCRIEINAGSYQAVRVVEER